MPELRTFVVELGTGPDLAANKQSLNEACEMKSFRTRVGFE